ncbi:hypothetical protein G6F31_017562 [Rhizopus arrhizus]|nr:hypothetical protein G6F31_017562 [Rhizopus arrhizus]
MNSEHRDSGGDRCSSTKHGVRAAHHFHQGVHIVRLILDRIVEVRAVAEVFIQAVDHVIAHRAAAGRQRVLAQFGEAERVAVLQRMPRPADEAQRGAREQVQVQVVVRRDLATVQDQRVDGAFAQFLQLHVGGAAAELYLDGGVALHHVLQQVHGQHRRRGRAQAQAQGAGFDVRQDLGAAPQFGQLDPHPPRAGQRQFAQGMPGCCG